MIKNAVGRAQVAANSVPVTCQRECLRRPNQAQRTNARRELLQLDGASQINGRVGVTSVNSTLCPAHHDVPAEQRVSGPISQRASLKEPCCGLGAVTAVVGHPTAELQPPCLDLAERVGALRR